MFSNKTAIAVVIAIKIILMYIPIISVTDCDISSIKEVQCDSRAGALQKDEVNINSTTYGKGKVVREEGESCDEDLFSCAAEITNPPLQLIVSEVGFELQCRKKPTIYTNCTTVITTATKTTTIST